MSNGSFLCDFRISANVHEGRTVTTETQLENRVLGLVVGTLTDRFEMTLHRAEVCQISGIVQRAATFYINILNSE